MRSAFVDAALTGMSRDARLSLLLGDIGVHGFRQAFAQYPDRTFNVGILEQAMVSIAAGMSKSGLIPVLHTIAPFLVERALEQIKVDIGYQGLAAKLVTVGASTDYAALGATHHCPGDVLALSTIEGIEIVVPGTSEEFRTLFADRVHEESATYFRLSELENASSKKVIFGEPHIESDQYRPVVISVGPVGETVEEAIQGLPVSCLYFTTLRPLDQAQLGNLLSDRPILIVEPLYRGTFARILIDLLPATSLSLSSIGYPTQFQRGYGLLAEHLANVGLDVGQVRERVKSFLGA